MGTRATVKIVKGKDAYINMTALSEYCRQKGYKIIGENVTIEMPTGKELRQFNNDVRSGKIRIIE